MPALSAPLALSPGRRALAVLLACAALLAACGNSTSRFIANKTEKVYLKVPRAWVDRPYGDTEADALEEITSDVTMLWRSAAAPEGDAGVDAPLMTTAIYEVSGQLNQKMSASLARIAGSPVPFDPVLPTDDTQKGQVEVLDYAPLDFKGMNGTRAVFRVRDDATSDWKAVYSVSTAFNLSTFRLYILRVSCSADCFEKNKDAISSVASSWLVKP
jgi:hypothetical protein